MKYHNIKSIDDLIFELTKLPSVGPKTAQRLAFYIVNSDYADCKNLSDAILNVKKNIKPCKACYNLTDKEICEICTDEKRDKSATCVVSEPQDIPPIENCREFSGLYHVLCGVISPLDGVGPEKLKINEPVKRVKEEKIKEVVLAVNTSLTGEATSIYIAKILKPFGVKVTRLALGLPAGADIEYADEITLSRAIGARMEI